MKWTNQEILRFNKENGEWGAYGTTLPQVWSNILVRHTVSHRWEQWREKEAQNMLYLSDERRLVMGQAVNKYFRFNII